MMNKVSSILVFRGGALGDLLLAGPALVQLRRRYPAAKITLVARSAYSELFVETLRPVALLELGSSRFSPLFLEEAHLPEGLKSFVGSFDLIVSWLGPPDEPFARNLLRAGAGRLLAAAAFPDANLHVHAADYFVKSLSDFDGLRRARSSREPSPTELEITAGEPLELTLPPYNAQTCDSLLADCDVKVTEPLFAVHPGSGGLRKCWPTERFVNVAHRLAEVRSMQVLWLVGPAELERPERFCTNLPGSFVVMASVPILMLAGVIQRARIYLGNDSGVTHLAAAVGTPTLAIFGPSAPQRWAPRCEHVQVLHKRRLNRLRQETVLERLMEMTAHIN